MLGGRKVVHMFSATMIPEIEMLGKAYLAASYTYITIGEPGGGKKEIDQHVELIDENSKLDCLTRIIRSLPGPIIVFANSRENCDKVSRVLQTRCDRRVAEYHGGKTQDAREKVIASLRTGKVEVLVATDLAGRGLDVKGISAVINYDAPKNISEFIHRSGRTGRAGMKGKAFTLLTPEDESLFYDLRVFLERNGFAVPENLRENPASQVRPGGVVSVARRKQIVYTN
jgi:ATP-dependent RNA helicase DDX23/PRP28